MVEITFLSSVEQKAALSDHRVQINQELANHSWREGESRYKGQEGALVRIGK